MSLLYLGRHGEIDDPGMCASSTDALLSRNGKQMSLASIEHVHNHHAGHIVETVSSGKKRTRLPSIHMHRHHGVPHRVEHGLNERDLGHWEQEQWLDIHAFEPDELERFLEDPVGFEMDTAECPQSFRKRVEGTAEPLLERRRGVRVAFGHALVNCVVLEMIDGRRRHPKEQELGCLNLIEITGTGATIIEENRVLYDHSLKTPQVVLPE